MALKQATAILKESGSLKRPSQKTDAPTFRAPEGDSTVWVEGDPCFEFNDVDQAVLGFVLSHSVLNCSFGKRYRGIASFIQRYVLGIRDGVPVYRRRRSTSFSAWDKLLVSAITMSLWT